MFKYAWRKSKKDPITPTSNTRPDRAGQRGFTLPGALVIVGLACTFAWVTFLGWCVAYFVL